MTKNKVYLKDIADLLHVSQNTVSLALRDMPGVKESTRENILKTAKELGYIRNINIATSTIFMVTTLDNSNDTYFYSYVQHAIEDELNKYGFKLVVMHFINEDKTNILQIPGLLNQINPKGILILGEINEIMCLELIESKLPVVCIAFYYPNITVDAVIEDNLSGVYSLMNYMFDKGYKTFGFIGDIKGYISLWERWVAFTGFLTEHSIAYDKNLCIVDHSLKDLSNSEWLADIISKMPKLPEAFICANDKIAATAIKVLHFLGYEVPKDIGITGYDNSELAKITIPSLTTVDSFRTQQGLATVNVILNKIKNQDKTVQKVVIPVKFIEGSSTMDKHNN
jgi:DNA-binding LacI/PurR family transcriptional regulator